MSELLPEFAETVDPAYLEQIKLLETRLNNAENDEEAYKSLQEFCQRYLMPWNLWEKFYDIVYELDEDNRKIEYFDKFADFHMFHPRESEITMDESCYFNKIYYHSREDTVTKFFDTFEKHGRFKCDLNILVKDLYFPHCDLDEIWAHYEMHSCSSPPKYIFEKYQKMKKLYARILLADEREDVEEWFKAVIESEHEEFICVNVEFEIGWDLSKKKLWKLYINYLRSHRKPKKMLQTYSKYCRFFLNDVEMKEEYENEMYEYGTLDVPWQNPFKWEYCIPESFGIPVETKIPRIPRKYVGSIQCKFSPKNAVSQTFPFKRSLMHYIQKDANAKVLYKLVTSCKFFYIQKPYLICYSLILSTNFLEESVIKIREHSMEAENYALSRLKNNVFFVSTVFQAYDVKTKILSRSIAKIARCTAKYISMEDVRIKRSDMEILLKEGSVVNFSLHRVTVVDSNGEHMLIEDMIKMIPKVNDLSIHGTKTTPDTLQKILEIPFLNKLDHFSFSLTEFSHFNNELYGEFIKKNCSSICVIETTFNFPHDQAYQNNKLIVEESDDFIKKLIEAHWKDGTKPTFSYNISTKPEEMP